jgi:predicted DNA-binding transcriptional regulator YafY
MSQKSSLHRTIEILKHLNEGKQLCVTRLAQEYEVSDRTIRRDFELIKELFGDFISKEGECYRAYKKVLLDEVLHATDLMTLANIVNLFGVTQKQSLISDKTKSLIDKSMTVYDFKSRPYENMTNHEVIKKLEHAIKFNKEIKVRYKTERATTQALFHPYKILFLNENFYLVGINASKNHVEYRRITMIEEVAYTKKGFFIDHKVSKFFSTLQTPWAAYGKEEIVIRLRIEVSIRRYFMKKKYLPSQEVVHTFDNGDIEVHYTITNLREIEELIIKWLPRIHVIAPRNLNKMIKRTLKRKMEGL